MPIKGLTDQDRRQFPRLGKLRKGGERQKKVNRDGKEIEVYGEELDYWRFTAKDDPEIEQVFLDAYGEKPRSIPVYIPNRTPEEAFTVWAEIWGSSGLVHRCDGVTMHVWLENGSYQRGSKPCPGGHSKGDYMNDAIGRLDVILPELIEAGYVGYVTMETHSKNDILSILSTLRAVYDARYSNELGLRGVLFNLRRVQERISVPGFGNQAGKRSRVDKWLVKLEPSADWVRLQIEMANAAQMQLEPGQRTLQLSSGEDADAVTGEIIDHQDPVQDPGWDPNGHQEEQSTGFCPSCGQSGGYHASNCPEFRKQLGGPPAARNGNPPAACNGSEKPKMPISQAVEAKTPKGSRLGDLDIDQLKIVQERGDDQLKEAATVLLSKVPAEAFTAWSELANRAKELGANVDPIPGDVIGIDFYRRYVELKNLIQYIQAEDDQAIPEEFRR